MTTGRPRDPAVDAAIRKAALELTAESGYKGMSIEGIAARSGVAKQTIYRRYRTKGEIILDALATDVSRTLPVPDTGNLRDDLDAMLRMTFSVLNGAPGAINRALMTEALQDEEFATQFRERHIKVRRDVLREILTRARARGEVGYGNLDFLIDLAFGAMWYRLLVRHAPLDGAYASEIADAITLIAAPKG